MMESETTKCYYCPWATDDLQTCINHMVELHGDKVLKNKAAALDERTGMLGMKTKHFGLIPNELEVVFRGKYMSPSLPKPTFNFVNFYI